MRLQEIARGVRAGDIDPVELAERALARAEEAAELGAVVHLDPEGALRTAERVRTGPLAGVPVLVKELIEVEGMPFTCGSEVFAGRTGQKDAEIVARLRAAGAVVIGLTYTHEFAYGCTGVTNRRGVCRNPRDRTRMAGGSSSGSAAAVAAGIVPLALGTDTAGSVRIPAALCGVVGVKPAYGTLPTQGVFPLAPSLDHVGVLAGDVEDAAYAVRVLGRLVGGRERITPRLAVPAHLGECAPEVAEAFARATESLTDKVWLPDAEQALADLQGPEAAAVHEGIFLEKADQYQAGTRDMLEAAARVPGWRYVRALRRRKEIIAAAEEALRGVDAVVMPTVPILAPRLDEPDVRQKLLRNTRFASLTGLPAVSLPMPVEGPLPAGLQVVGLDETRVLAAAAWLENALDQSL
ncbi:amidase [Nonomuraea sp. NPDC050536]|uniref:amidase n=1 Tax=Nonomuraea sp. NPDC050536 TaxID=3364366 RepID=UPI0037C81034